MCLAVEDTNIDTTVHIFTVLQYLTVFELHTLSVLQGILDLQPEHPITLMRYKAMEWHWLRYMMVQAMTEDNHKYDHPVGEG